MNIEQLSKTYHVRRITEEDIPEVLDLCKGNPQYYEYCPPSPSIEGIKEDLQALPPEKTYDDKYYVGFYDNDMLIAVMDLILKYPNEETAFIGFFMMDRAIQGKGIGSFIIKEVTEYLSSIGYSFVRLGYVKENPQPRGFWTKAGFTPVGIEVAQDLYTIVVLEKKI